MKTKAYQDNLIEIISVRTGQKKEIVAAYIMAQFEEIEKLLAKTSTANVDGLGVFRIMKTSSNKKILFIPKFDNLDVIAKNIYDTSVSEKEITNPPTTAKNYSSGIQPVTPDNATDLQSNGDQPSADLLSSEKALDSSSDIYKDWDNLYSNKKKKYNWAIILLIAAVALIGIFLVTTR